MIAVAQREVKLDLEIRIGVHTGKVSTKAVLNVQHLHFSFSNLVGYRWRGWG